MEIASFQPMHLETFIPGAFDRIETEDVQYAAHHYWPGHALSVRDNDRTLAIVGVGLEGETGRGWAYLSDEMRRHQFYLHRNVKRALPKVAAELGFRRIEVEVHRDFQLGHRWVERLGFYPVGLPSGLKAGLSRRNRVRLMHDRTFIEYEKWL